MPSELNKSSSARTLLWSPVFGDEEFEEAVVVVDAALLVVVTVVEVVVSGVVREDGDFHARFDAVRREYTYFIHRKKDPFVESYSYRCSYPGLDFEAMNEAASLLLGRHDFSCFEKSGGAAKTPFCTVFEARWTEYTPSHVAIMGPVSEDCSYWYFRISADRFLRNMVRAVVGTLIDIGRGRYEPSRIKEILDGKGSRSDAGESVPGHALFLSSVQYPSD